MDPMSAQTILGYKVVKFLGKGTFTQTYLTQTQTKALKVVKQIMINNVEQQPPLLQHLKSQKQKILQLQKQNDTPVMKHEFLKKKKDNQMEILFVSQYCEYGSLLDRQRRMQHGVFEMADALDIIKSITQSLEYLKTKNYYYHGIKMQNILICQQNNKTVYKLDSLGFSCKNTKLYTHSSGYETYLSPQGFQEEEISQETSVWSLGVLLFYMLNGQFPFSMKYVILEFCSPRLTYSEKNMAMTNMACHFSYEKSVKCTYLKLSANCNEKIENFFKRVFQIRRQARITFSEILDHPIFHNNLLLDLQSTLPKSSIKIKSKNITSSIYSKMIDSGQKTRDSERNRQHYLQQNRLLQTTKDKIDLLKWIIGQLLQSQFLQKYEKDMVCYNLLKYHVILLQQMNANLNQQFWGNIYAGLNWEGYLNQNRSRLENQIDFDINQSVERVEEFAFYCIQNIQDIRKVDESFELALIFNVNNNKFDGTFKQSYRLSTAFLYRKLIKRLKAYQNECQQEITESAIENLMIKKKRIQLMIVLVLIAHIFNRIRGNESTANIIFEQYLTERNKSIESINYEQLKQWLINSDSRKMKQMSFKIIQNYPKQ